MNRVAQVGNLLRRQSWLRRRLPRGEQAVGTANCNSALQPGNTAFASACSKSELRPSPAVMKKFHCISNEAGQFGSEMVPDEQPKALPEQAPALIPRGPRRSRRGGRRHSRRRSEPRLSGPQPGDTGESAPAIETPASAREPERNFRPERESAPNTPAISQAIEQVNRVIEDLKGVLNDMEVVLETLELAERQKIDDERELDSLQRALRQLHRPSPGRP